MPKAPAAHKQHFCLFCGKPFRTDNDLRRHISCSKDAGHRALLTNVKRGTLRPGRPPLPPPVLDEEDEWMDEDAVPPVDEPPAHLDEPMPDAEDLPIDSESAQQDAHRAQLEVAEADEPVREVYASAGAQIRQDRSPHTDFDNARQKSGLEFYPFPSQVDYDFARWLLSESVKNAAFERLMKVDTIREKLGLSFKTGRELKKILAKIPWKTPWMKRIIKIPGLKGRKFVVLYRDPKLVIREMWSRFNLEGKIALQPEHLFTDESRRVRVYNEFKTGDWMWKIQRKLPHGATVVPLTLFQDKTQLCQLIGVESNIAYPMYLTISSIDSSIQRNISSNVHEMVALLPIVNLKGLGLSQAKIRFYSHQITHKAMRVVFDSLYEASHSGMELTTASGKVYEGYPILAVEGLDYPEQCLHTACRGCPKCGTKSSKFSGTSTGPARSPAETLAHIRQAMKEGSFSATTSYLKNHGLNYVLEPFWKDWEHVDIHEAIAPDVLHQLYQGLIKHLTAWCRAILGDKEMDARMASMPPAFGLRHFENGISSLQRVSGTEHRAISRQLACVMADANIDKRVIRAVTALIDYVYMVQYKCHSDDTLGDTQDVLDRFHANKKVFLELGACESFNFPKMHMLNHYIPGIKLFGALGPISTDVGERLHIDKLKNLYQLTNKKCAEYPAQICTLLTAKNRMDWLGHYLAHAQGTSFEPRKRTDTQVHQPVEFAKKPAAQRTLPQLVAEHKAVGLERALNDFLQDLIDTEWAKHTGPPPGVPWLSPYMKWPVWHNIKFFTPDLQTLSAKDTRDVAYAVPKRQRDGHDPNDDDSYLGARFSPVFVKEGGELAGEGGTEGLRIGHLRVIFELPPMIIEYLKEAHIPLPGKLAFVQWFTKLGRRDVDSGMFKVTADTEFARGQGAQRVRRCAVIHAIDIRRSAYLAPRLGRDTPNIPEELTSENVLEEWKGEFWVNNHLDPAMFRSLL